MIALANDAFYDQLTEYLKCNQERLYRLAYSYTFSEQDALDVVQSAILKALRSRPLRQPRCLRTWMYRILVNTALDWLRSRKRLVPASDDYFEQLSDKLEDPPDPDLRSALEQLPAEYRTIVVKRFFEELKLSEVAQVTGLNVNTVKTRLYRALQLMRVEMEVEEDE